MHVVLVFDRSGSMQQIWEKITQSFKEFIQSNREKGHTMSLYMFNDEINRIVDFQEIKEVDESLFQSYAPNGLTKLMDAIGVAMVETGNLIRDDRGIMFVIMTDGHENSSTKYTKSQIKEMIQHQETKYNWQFKYFGVNSLDQAMSLGIQDTQSYVNQHVYASESLRSVTKSI